jgi:diguanylate cyclase (GGDEF)-like protein
VNASQARSVRVRFGELRRRLAALRWDWGDALVVVAGAIVATYGVLYAYGLQDERLRTAVTDLVYLPVDVILVVLGARAASQRRLHRRVRLAWWLVTASIGGQLFGDVVWAWLEVVRRLEPSPSLADVGYLLFIPLMLAALLAFPTSPRTRRELLRSALDAWIVMASGFMIVWYLVIAPPLADGQSDRLTAAILVAYPVGDLLLIFGMVTLLHHRVTAGSRRPLQALLAGLLLFVVADVYFTYVGLRDIWVPGSLPDLCWLGAYLLFAVAANDQRRQASRSPAQQPRSAAPAISNLPYVAVAIAYAMLFAVASQQDIYPVGGMIFGAVAITGLVLLRQRSALRESRDVAITDSLTGIANRLWFHDRLGNALAQSRRRGHCTGLLRIDLDEFKAINDSLGHEAGDMVLIAVGKALRGATRAPDAVGRLGGDEFAVALLDIAGPSTAVDMARRVLAALETPVIFQGHLVSVRASIGIAVSDDTTIAADELLRRADVAMYAAKRGGRGRCQLYSPELDTAALTAELRGAVDDDQLVIHYQPIVELGTGRTLGVEALVRWQHPTRGLLPPGEFIPLAEESGVIVGLGAAVIRQACHQVRDWSGRFSWARGLSLFVNLSPRQLRHPSLVSEVTAVLRQTRVEPSQLVLEITEGSLVRDEPATIAKIDSLRGLGVRFAIDDFGTGFSSLSYLKRLPIDILKIDASFTADLLRSERDLVLGQTIVQLGRALGMEVVLEGIETTEQLDALRQIPGLRGQGYRLARPQTAAGLEGLLEVPQPEQPER